MHKVFVWNKKIEVYQGKIDQYILNNQSHINGYEFIQVPEDLHLSALFDYLKQNDAYALVHRNEHGLLHCTAEWVAFTNRCLENKIPVLSFDFGYFDHYNSFMVDFYTHNCISSIYHKWKTFKPTFDWNRTPAYMQKHRKSVLEKFEAQKAAPNPLNADNLVTVWGQWTTELIKHYFYQNGRHIPMDEWIRKLVPIIKDKGFSPAVKMSPVKSLRWFEELQKELPVFIGRKSHMSELPDTLYEKNVNSVLMVHSKFNIINCSSVSNELFLTDSKVIAMGRSWFDGLGVFYEPKNWGEIMDYKEPHPVNKNKWCNWWLECQCELKDLPEKIISTIDEARKYGNY